MGCEGHTWCTQVRAYECDSLGHVNNAWYLAYLQQATAEAWAEMAPVTWALRRLAIEYVAPATAGDELAVTAWPAGREEGCLACGYEVRRTGDGTPVARAQAAWAWPGAGGRRPLPSLEAWPVSTPAGRALPRPLRLPPDSLGGRAFHWQHHVRRYELGASGQAGPVEILRWIEETKYAACVEAGWPPERMAEADAVAVQVRHDTGFMAALHYGDPVEIVSRVYDLGRVKGMWRHEVYRDGELVVLDYSTGAFLDRSGRPNPPPQAMLEALVRGA